MPVYEVDDACCKLAAGWLIEQCGWKGRTLGKAGVHDKQALVLVNQGGASGIEIARLANEVRKSVFMKFGIWIEPEVYVIWMNTGNRKVNKVKKQKCYGDEV